MAEPLRLFIKTGAPGAEPEGFYDAVADTFDADLISTDEVHLEQTRGSHGQLIFNKEMTRVVRNVTEQRARASLRAGRSVVYDGFLNTPKRRETVCSRLAKPFGARVVSLCVEAPWYVIEERIIDRYQADSLPMPTDLTRGLEHYLGIVADIQARNQWPDEEEGLHTIKLDGTKPLDVLISEVARQLSH